MAVSQVFTLKHLSESSMNFGTDSPAQFAAPETVFHLGVVWVGLWHPKNSRCLTVTCLFSKLCLTCCCVMELYCGSITGFYFETPF